MAEKEVEEAVPSLQKSPCSPYFTYVAATWAHVEAANPGMDGEGLQALLWKNWKKLGTGMVDKEERKVAVKTFSNNQGVSNNNDAIKEDAQQQCCQHAHIKTVYPYIGVFWLKYPCLFFKPVFLSHGV